MRSSPPSPRRALPRSSDDWRRAFRSGGVQHVLPALESRWLPSPIGRSTGSQRHIAVACGTAVLLVALLDFLTGYELLFSVFYLLPTGFATLLVGLRSGVFFSLLAVVLSQGGDLASGVGYDSDLALLWNFIISSIFYLAVVLLVNELRSTHINLEGIVARRTSDLQREIEERSRVEAMLLEVSERGQRRVGNDLHDSLCQHLTATAMAAQILSRNLESSSGTRAAEADRLVTMLEQSIGLSRSLARGLAPVELDAEGLMTALAELAKTTSSDQGVDCRLILPEQVLINDSSATVHLFRIAQEAVRNAIRHGRAKKIEIRLTQEPDRVRLSIEDDGSGFHPDAVSGDGMGLSIMRYRADMIPATFGIERLQRGMRLFVEKRDEHPDPAMLTSIS